jgi:hypothetical protein
MRLLRWVAERWSGILFLAFWILVFLGLIALGGHAQPGGGPNSGSCYMGDNGVQVCD